jgi:hypothetical protein
MDTGGSAFPGKAQVLANADTPLYVTVDAPGMTLVDYFAGQALASLLATPQQWKDDTAALASRMAYDMAEAMLAERDRRLFGKTAPFNAPGGYPNE